MFFVLLTTGLTADEPKIIRDQPYKEGDQLSQYEQQRCRLDWYLPKGVTDFPTLIWFHGGGLQNGHKADDIAVTIGERFVAEGIAVASINYRLSPKAKYPAYVEDAAAAVAFVRKSVEKYGGSPQRVFVSGHSAGGYLTSMVGMNPKLLARHGLKRRDLAGYIPVAGQMVTHSTVRGERGIARTQPVIDQAAPAFHATADTAPFLCFAGDNDLPARSEENRYFAAVMKAAGHDSVRFIEVADRDHGTVASRMGDPDDEVAQEILQFIGQSQTVAATQLQSAVEHLAAATNYSWTTTVTSTFGQRGQSTTQGKADQQGRALADLRFGRFTVQVAIDGSVAAVTNRDRRWETVSLLDRGYRSTGFSASTAQSMRIPAVELREIGQSLSDVKQDGTTIVGRLSDDRAAAYLFSQRGGDSEVKDVVGTVRLSLAENQLSHYEIHVEGRFEYGDESQVQSRTLKTIISDVGESQITMPDRAVSALKRPLPAPQPRLSEEEAERILAASGKRDLRIHDPSSIVRCGGEYWMFSTGTGVLSWRSKDLVEWQSGPPVFQEIPDWVREVVPSQRGHFWAPDVIRIGDRYLLYYSVSSFGSNISAIALASTPTLDPDADDFAWTDHGIVVRTKRRDNYNAIDPAVITTDNGELWMSFGSFWDGLKMLRLDPDTGKQMTEVGELLSIARYEAIEAPHIFHHNGYYYLFVNWDRCCRGVESTYNIRVGRSRSISGPYLDKDGVDLAEGGGTLFLETDGPFIGPGHANVLRDADRFWFSCHYYDGTQRGRSMFSIRPLEWTDNGWPMLRDAETVE